VATTKTLDVTEFFEKIDGNIEIGKIFIKKNFIIESFTEFILKKRSQ
jgi:hypothetical protein